MSHIIKSKQGKAGYITLDRPKALNSLSHEMIVDFHEALQSLETDTDVEVIVVRSSSERAFCAGGDMKTARELAIDKQWQKLQHFFDKEYALNLHIAQCKKPYISLVSGIAMGGGLGLSAHGDVMVVSETAKLAMPETAIGFFPDVGGTYFLNQLTHDAGKWLSLTGIPVNGVEAVTIGLATHSVHSKHWDTLTSALEQIGAEALDSVLPRLTDSFDDTDIKQLLDQRQNWFNAESHNDLVTNLEAVAESAGDSATKEDAVRLLKRAQRMSPFAMDLTRQLLKNAKGKDLPTCLQLELKAADEAVRHADFEEGIRAVLVDKDAASWTSSNAPAS